MTCFTLYHSPIGPLRLTSDGTALTGLWLGDREPEPAADPCREDLAIFNSAKRWLDDYFSGNPREIDFPLAPFGTPFQRRVWELLQTVPYGKATTYGALAGQLGPKMSAQAVGQALGKNPILILIPCHRCLGAGERLTGFSAGLDRKRWLLCHEGIHFTQ
ncbi:MAG: methylated-DNA--[protein]-cysteine S-methyltransferase [Ruminococcaceae bacterium]|nr:methylated-DNA--[protein]-cysteine S-methyltransferase [Oscillospiraceae bacterium]